MVSYTELSDIQISSSQSFKFLNFEGPLNGWQASVAKLVSRSLAGQSKSFRDQSATSCAQILALLNQISDELGNNPASQLVGRLAEQVKNATDAGVTCSSSEIAALQAANSDIDQSEAELADVLSETQNTLEGTL
jgi:hypothetical protein